MIYADYAATHPYVKYPSSAYGPFLNPNANYAYKEKRLLSEAENRVKKVIGAKGGKVVFGGTSSQLIENLFTHIAEETNEYITLGSSCEHDAMWRFIDDARKDICSLEHAIRTYHSGKRLIVSLMGINNLTGEIFPIEEIGKLCHEHDAFYICDMTAMLGHTPIPTNIDQWCDCAVWSGHKLGTELGIGAMWVSDHFDKWLNGFKLHGTPDLAGALAMTQAVEDACDTGNLSERIIHFNKMQDCLINCLVKNRIDFRLVPDDNTCPSGHEFTLAINAIRLPGFNARTLQSYLASKEIYIGLGQSSCADKADRRVLCQGYGLSEQEADEVVRISFGEDSNIEDVKILVENICEFKKIYLDN